VSAFLLYHRSHKLTFCILKVPNVTRIVYSTCSVHAIENEHVVSEALQSDEATIGNFKLAPANEVLPQWPRRGLPEEMGDPGKHCYLLDYLLMNLDYISSPCRMCGTMHAW